MISKPSRRKVSSRSQGAPRATQATSARLKELWATPEFREKMKRRDQARIAEAKDNPTKFSRHRVPDGMRRGEAERLWARANTLADRFIVAIKQAGEIPDEEHEIGTKHGTIFVPVTDDGKAEAALREAFVLAVGPSTPQVKAQAINTILTFTKARPANKAALMLVKPEDFLDAIINEASGTV
jgi:hypothetical protein